MSSKPPSPQEASTSSASPQYEAQVIIHLLDNRLRGDQRAWVILNAALFIYAAGLAPSLAKATPLAHDMLESGKADAFYHNLVSSAVRPSEHPDSLSSPLVPA
jgi:anthranilate phosphoribosyltransferase